MKYRKKDFQLGVMSLVDNIGLKTKNIDKSKQNLHEPMRFVYIQQELATTDTRVTTDR